MLMNEWEPALTKEECNNRELGACYCGECVKQCKCGGELFPMDTDDHECDCGAVYCGACDAEYSKEGELLSGGVGL